MTDLNQHRTPEFEAVQVTAKAEESQAKHNVNITHGLWKYFQAILKRLDHLEYGDPAEYLQKIHSIEAELSSLDKVMIQPRFKMQDESGIDVTLENILSQSGNCKIILADPGCGKSTVSRFICCHLTRQFQEGSGDHFGVFVPLSMIQLSGRTYQEAVVYCAARFVHLETDAEVLTDLRNSLDKACILLDGLDELPVSLKSTQTADLTPLRQEIGGLVNSLRFIPSSSGPDKNPAKILITSRVREYQEDKSVNLTSAPVHFMNKFSPAQMNSAVEMWHNTAKSRIPPGSPLVKTLEERNLGILSAFKENPDLATICLTPLMLNALLTVYSDNNDLPSSVSQLCWRAINWFFIEKHKKMLHDSFIQEYGEWLLESIINVGWYSQIEFVKAGTRSFTNQQLRDWVRQSNTMPAFKHLEYEQQENLITNVVSFLRKGHGILAKVSNDEFDFVHNVFREVLAGKALGKLSVPERTNYATNKDWIGPIRYWAGLRAVEKDGIHEICAFVSELMDEELEHRIDAVLACGEMLSEVSTIVPARTHTRDLKRHITKIRKIFSDLLQKDHPTVSTRIRIGDLLATLGDSRLNNSGLDRIHWIDGGEYSIGRQSNHTTRIAKYQKCPASPVTTGSLKKYGMGKYLVTNEDFNQFIIDGGYNNATFWNCETGLKWATGDDKTINLLIKWANDAAKVHLSSEIVSHRLIPDQVPDHCIQMIQRRLPLYWSDPLYNRANQPVVGINWWEAMAYCNWLDKKLKDSGVIVATQRVRLPTEAEWEVAAKKCGNGGDYPWIDGQPGQCALVKNSFAKGDTSTPVFRPCAVGLFGFVRTNIPLYDMTGNVWEWTASKVANYGPLSFDQTVDDSCYDERIGRGSSWMSSEEESTAVTFRSFDPPYNAYQDLGFRIVIQ